MSTPHVAFGERPTEHAGGFEAGAVVRNGLEQVMTALPTSGGGAPVLVYLSNEYAAATTAERRTALATVAEGRGVLSRNVNHRHRRDRQAYPTSTC